MFTLRTGDGDMVAKFSNRAALQIITESEGDWFTNGHGEQAFKISVSRDYFDKVCVNRQDFNFSYIFAGLYYQIKQENTAVCQKKKGAIRYRICMPARSEPANLPCITKKMKKFHPNILF